MFNIKSQGAEGRKRMKSSKEDETKAVVRPCLPDLVIHRILELLPTKAALRMSFLSKQWEDVPSMGPVIDLDESARINDGDIVFEKLVEHSKFINTLQYFLQLCEKNKTSTQVLDRFRLRMTRYLFKDANIVDKWLSHAYERSVKEVDLSLEIAWNKPPNPDASWRKRLEFYYCISPVSLFHAKSVTSLNLEFVRIKNTYSAELRHARVLPSLKNLSLKSVYLDFQAVSGLILECPLIERLSLVSCYVEYSGIRISSSTLKFLNVTYCDAPVIDVDNAVSLEYFTLSEVEAKSVTLRMCHNLKYISIRAQCLKSLGLNGCPDSMEATIHTPSLLDFNFSGFLKSGLYLEAPKLRTSYIVFEDDYKETSHNFVKQRDFLKAIDGAENVNMRIRDFQVIIFPKKIRETLLSPCPRLKQLILFISIPPTKEEDISELQDSLAWMVPSKSYYWREAID